MKSKLFMHILLLAFLVNGSGAEAQEKTSVSGIVTSFKLYPLFKVKVVAAKSGEVTYTDSAGRFTIPVLKKDVLTAAADGFSEKNVKVRNKKVYSIDLLYKDSEANYNKAVNAGHISEGALRKAVFDSQSVNKRDYSRYTTIYELIENEIYNVSVRGTGIYNKKIRSFDATPQVLYVVDNKIVPDISFVAPNYVETIEFIDDVGATMYGVSGANGVIRITLK